jgi:hypothetical protein
MRSAQRNTVAIWDYYRAEPEEKLVLIPPCPALYVWTYNVERLLGVDRPTAEEKLLNLMAVVGQERNRKVGPYTNVTVRDERKPIKQSKAVILHERLSQRDGYGAWLAAVTTEIQRPIYIGMTHSLNRRVNEHLDGRTGLRARIEKPEPKSFTLTMLDLAVSWWSPPEPDNEPPLAAENLESHDSEPAEPLESNALEPDALEPDDDASLTDPALDRFLKASESLLIRMAMPMFNDKQD